MNKPSRLIVLAPGDSIHTEKWLKLVCKKFDEVKLLTFEPTTRIDSEKFTTEEFSKNLYGLLKIYYRLIISLMNDKNVIVHAHYATLYGLILCILPHKHTVLSVWGSDVYEFPYRSILHRILSKLILLRPKVVCSTSQVMANHCEKLLKRKYHVVPFPVDTELFQPRYNENTVNKRIGTVKSLERIYGIDVLINAFAALITRYEDEDISLHIVGMGSELESLKKLTRSLKIEDKVFFEGKKSQVEVAEFISELKIFASFSRAESFGVSALEAMSCAIPVTASTAPGFIEIIQNNKTGFTFGIDNLNEIVDCWEKLIDDDNFYQKIATAAREHVLLKYSNNHFLTAQMKVYHEV